MGTRPPGNAVQPRSALQLLYWGGTIQQRPKIYIVFWGFGGKKADPSHEAARVTQYASSIGKGTYLDVLKQYGETGGAHIENPRGQLAGTWIDTTNRVPASPSANDIGNEALALAAHFGIHDRNADYIVATPHNHNETGFFSSFCSWHGQVFIDSTSSPFTSTYLTVTYLPYVTDAGASCGEDAVNHAPQGLLDGVSILLGHELAESRTDPLNFVPGLPKWAGWHDLNNQEIADKCQWTDLQNNKYGGSKLGIDEFPNQPLWSNASGRCVQPKP